MAKSISWKTASTYGHAKSVVVNKDVADKWHVDRFPSVQTRTAKVAYGDLKVTKRYGKK